MTGREFRLGCALVGLVALALRLDFLAAWRASPFFGSLFIDPATYDRWARLFASGQDWTAAGVYPRAPLYVWFLGTVYSLFGHDLFVPRFLQALAGSLACVLLALLGRRFLSPLFALLGALLAAFSWPLIFFDAQLLFPTLIVLLEVLFLLALPSDGDFAPMRFPLAGALLGALSLASPLALPLLPAFAILVLYSAGGMRAAVLLAAGCLLILAPVTLHNRLAGGEWVAVSANGGYNFFVGNNAEADGLSVWSSQDAIQSAGYAAEDAGDASRSYFRLAWRWIADRPLDFLDLLLRKTYYLVNAREVPSNFPIDHIREVVPSRAGSLAFPGFGVLGPLALLGCLFAWRRPGARPVLLFIVLYSLGIVLFFVNARFRAPLLPLLCLMAALALTGLLDLARQDSRRFAAAAVLLAALASLVNSSLFGIAERRRDAPLHAELGKVFARHGMLGEAEREFRRAVDLDPERGRDRHLLASVIVQQGRYDEAEAHFRRAVAGNPTLHETWNSLGNLAAMRGEKEAATALYQRALSLAPDYEPARSNLLRLGGTGLDRGGERDNIIYGR